MKHNNKNNNANFSLPLIGASKINTQIGNKTSHLSKKIIVHTASDSETDDSSLDLLDTLCNKIEKDELNSKIDNLIINIKESIATFDTNIDKIKDLEKEYEQSKLIIKELNQNVKAQKKELQL